VYRSRAANGVPANVPSSAKEPRNTGAPLDEHGQIFFHDLCQDLLSGAVPLEVVTLGVVFS
jgi:hypothetical protein